MSLTMSSAPSRANASAVSLPMPLPAPVTDTSVSPKASRLRPTSARNNDRLAGLPSRWSISSSTAAASTCGCDIGDQWPALMSRRHSRGTHRDRSSNPCGRTTGSFAPTTSCTGTLDVAVGGERGRRCNSERAVDLQRVDQVDGGAVAAVPLLGRNAVGEQLVVACAHHALEHRGSDAAAPRTGTSRSSRRSRSSARPNCTGRYGRLRLSKM